MDRGYFTEKLKKLGFIDYQPPGDIHKFIPREYLKNPTYTVALSPRDTAIEVKVFGKSDEGLNQINTFEDYSSASKFITKQDEPEVVVKKVKSMTKRKKT